MRAADYFVGLIPWEGTMFGSKTADEMAKGMQNALAQPGLEHQVKALTERINALQSAFDAWFDLVAADLGFEAATVEHYNFGVPVIKFPASPRKAAQETTSVVKRTKPCKKR